MKNEQMHQMHFNYWHDLFMNISMDLVRPLFYKIGLLISSPLEFQILVRNNIKKFEKRSSNKFESRESSYPFLHSNILDSLLQEIEIAFSKNDITNFICFATTVYESESGSHRKWKNWYNIIVNEFGQKRLNIKEVLTNNEINIFDKIFEKFKLYGFSSSALFEIDQLYDDSVIENLTEWDKYIFDLNKFDLSDSVADPFIDLRITALMYNFQLFWNEYILHLPDDELDVLYSAGLKMNSQRETKERVVFINNYEGKMEEFTLPAYIPDHLVYPRDLSTCIDKFHAQVRGT